MTNQNATAGSGSQVIQIDRTKNTPLTVLGEEPWKISWQDPRSVALTEIDLGKVLFSKGGYLMVSKSKKPDSCEIPGYVPLDVGILLFLLRNPGFIPEDWKGKYIFFHGTSLLDPMGVPSVFYLHWHAYSGRWYKQFIQFGTRSLGFTSAILAV